MKEGAVRLFNGRRRSHHDEDDNEEMVLVLVEEEKEEEEGIKKKCLDVNGKDLSPRVCKVVIFGELVYQSYFGR